MTVCTLFVFYYEQIQVLEYLRTKLHSERGIQPNHFSVDGDIAGEVLSLASYLGVD